MRKLLSLVLVVCMLMSAFGAVTAFGASGEDGSYTGGGAVGGGGSSSVIPSTPSIGGGGSSSGGSGGGSSSGSSSLANGYANEIYMDLICDGDADIYRKFYSGDLEFTGTVHILSSERAEIFAAIALYDVRGALTDFAFRAKTVSSSDGEFRVELPGVNTGGTIKCMLIDGATLSPLCPAKTFNACSDSLKVDLRNVDYSQDTALNRTENYTIDCYLTDEATRATTVDISSDVELYINGEQANINVELENYSEYAGTVEFVENNNDKYVDRIDITIYEYGIVDEVILEKERIVFVNGDKVTFDSSDAEQEVNIYDNQGNSITIADIQPGDTLAMMVGDLDSYSHSRPVSARLFNNKITIYNLGDTSIEGTISGMQQDVMKINVNDVWYRSAYTYVTDDFYDWREFLNNPPVGREGMFYIGLFGELIGIKLYRDCTYGFILQTHLNEYGFEPQYQVRMLTENDGIVVYNVDTRCVINDYMCDVSSQRSYLELDVYNAANNENILDRKTDASYRLVQYYTNKDGEIDDIFFLKDLYKSSNFRYRDGEYYKPTSTLWDVVLTDDTIIFNVSGDTNEACRITKDNLYDEAEYEGYRIKDSYSDDYNIIIIYSGTLFKDESEEEETIDNNLGFILISESNPASFEDNYQMSLLTEAEGIVTYDVASRCTINGYRYTTDEQGEFLNIPRYNKSGDESGRVIDFKLDGNGKISSITFVNNNDSFVNFNGECYGGKIGDVEFSYKAIIFDLSNDNLAKAETVAGSDLFMGSVYGGVASSVDVNGHYNIAVLTNRTAYLYPGTHLKVVDSAQAISYGEDAIDALEVKYFTDGINDVQTIIFTEDSVNIIDDEYDYKQLGKGTIFEANIRNGLVAEYAIVAELVDGSYALSGDLRALTETIYNSKEVDSKGEKTELVYGYISDIDGKTITLGGTPDQDFCDGRDFVIYSSAAQYCYNTESIKPRIVVGDYYSKGVDVYQDGQANLVLLKLYDDEVTDIISFSERVYTDTPGIIAQTHYTGPGLDLN